MADIKIVKLFQELWDLYGESIENDKNIRINDNDILLDEFFFVILGGYGISYELNRSGLEVIKSKGLINKFLYSDDMVKETERKIHKEFSIKQFKPMTKNDELRKYRFIDSKPTVLANAGNWLLNKCEWDLYTWLHESEYNLRNKICDCPGIGMKSASWFLRNTGYNFDYAVLDKHILRFIYRIGIEVPDILTEKGYIYIEETLRQICNEINVSLGKMDYLLWILSRNGYLDYVRCN